MSAGIVNMLVITSGLGWFSSWCGKVWRHSVPSFLGGRVTVCPIDPICIQQTERSTRCLLDGSLLIMTWSMGNDVEWCVRYRVDENYIGYIPVEYFPDFRRDFLNE